MKHLALVVAILAGCGDRETAAPKTAAAAGLEAFEIVWRRAVPCWLGPEGQRDDLDPRDALPLEDARDRGEEELGDCGSLDELGAAVPPGSPELAAAVRELPALWSATHSSDDTGRHTSYDALEAFANGLRDVDDWRVAGRRAAGLAATPLSTSRVPLAALGPALSPKISTLIPTRPLQDHALMIAIGGERDRVLTGLGTGDPLGPAWTATIHPTTYALTVSSPPAVVVAASINGQIAGLHGTGNERAIIVDRQSDDARTIFVSHDAGATWRVGLSPVAIHRVVGDLRAHDFIARSPDRWIHVGADGVLAASVPIHGKDSNEQWTCASSQVLWLVDDDAHLAYWMDRAGAYGSMPFTGTGGFGCADRALLAPGDRGLTRCVAGKRACGDDNSRWGRADLTSDGIAVASATGSIITITRSGSRPSTIRTRIPPGASVEGFAVWADAPALVIRDEDRLLHIATPAR